jgi:hypothetical protein
MCVDVLLDGARRDEECRGNLRVGETCRDEPEVAPGQDDALILAVAVCVDQMTHD